MLNASKVEHTGKRERAPHIEAGTYPGRLLQVVSIGLQAQDPYEGNEKEPAHEILVVYELLDEFMPDEDGNEDKTKPRVLSENFVLYSLDSDLAKSTKRYLALDPNMEHGGDWSQLVGTPCMITVVAKTSKKGITYNNITGVSGMRTKDAAKAPELVNEPKVFDIDEPDMKVFWSLWKWVQNKCTKDNLDFEGSVLEQAIKDNPEPKDDGDTKEDSPKVQKRTRKVVEEVEDKVNEEEDW